MNLSKKLLALLLAAAMLLAVLPAYALRTGANGTRDLPADSDYDGIPDAYDVSPNNNVFTGKMKSGHDGTTTVSYTMDLRSFFGGNTVYHADLASISVIGSALAYYTPNDFETYLTFDTTQTWSGGSASKVDGVSLLQVHGFEDVKDYTLDSYGDDDICEMVIGHRTVEYNGEVKVIIAIWVRGTEPTSMEEWSSNFNVGDLVRFFDAYDSEAGKSPRQSNDDWTRKTNHRGFDVCATRLLNYLRTYYLDEFVQPVLNAIPEASLTYWLTGHSRGGAVANIMASYLIDEGNEVYAYTFASPNNTANTEASAEKYDCIFNLVNSNDFVPTLPMTEWGFTRFGKTAMVDASQYSTQIKNATGVTYDGSYLTSSDISTMLGKFICITGENADRDNPGKILGWREVYVYHCGHNHAGETNGNYQSSTFRAWGIFGPYETDYYNKYPIRLQKYSYWDGGICQTPAYCMQVLVELMVAVATGEYLSGGWTYLTSNKLADKFDFNKQSLVSYATKLTEPHFMDTYSVIQAQINAAGDPGSRFTTLASYTASGTNGGRPAHTHTYTYVPYEGHEPTCTEPGLGYRYCLCSEHNSDYYDDYQKNVVIPATGHDWGDASYTWSEDHATCTATHTCLNDPDHVETETVTAIYYVVTEPTTSAPGLATYTAAFTNGSFETQVFEEVLAQLPYEDIYYTVTFVDWDGTVLSTQQVLEGTAATAPADPTREGYTFTGWDVDFSNVTSDITVMAQYVINTYTVTFVDWDGTVLKTETVEHGSAATAPAEPAREGYTFTGWDVDFSNVTSDITVTAQYVINTYTVTFVDWDGTVLKTQTVEHGASASAPAEPVREGYTFIGWDTDFTNVTSDLIVTAVYEQNAPAGLIGDVDCDGDVDFDDVTLLNAYLLNAAEVSEQGLINANVNGDNKVSSADVVALNKLILGSN